MRVKTQLGKLKRKRNQLFSNKKRLARLLNLSRVGEVTISVGNLFQSLHMALKKHLENWLVEHLLTSNALEFMATDVLVTLAG